MATGWPDELRRSSPFLGSSFGPAERRRARENAQRVIALKHSSCSPYVTEEVCRCSRSRSYGMASEFVRGKITGTIAPGEKSVDAYQKRSDEPPGNTQRRNAGAACSNRPARSDRNLQVSASLECKR